MVEPASEAFKAPDLRRYFPGSTGKDLRFLVGMGRLHPVKGFDLLLEAFALVHGNHPEWRLLIVGEGDERPRLEAIAGRHGLQDVVSNARLPD